MDVIAAIATGSAATAIGIVRVSGDGCFALCGRVFRAAGGRPFAAQEPRKMVFGEMLDRAGRVIDRGLAVRFPGPGSYTGEDCAEIHCHGSPVVLNEGLDALFSQGARQAKGGEFTQRAFLNGRMDLIQAEAVADLIDAESPAAARNAVGQLEGRLSRGVGEIYEGLMEVVSRFYAVVDYPDEDIDPLTQGQLTQTLARSETALEALLATFRRGQLLRQGVPAVILGKPNAGKSSLLNALLGYDRAIVTDVAGTTRDTVEEKVQVGHVLLRLCDTAGLRDSDDPIEQLGVARSRQALDQADLILLGPGSLYTSVIPNLLVEGVPEAIAQSDALKIYVCNIMTQDGETEGYTAGDHLEALMNHGAPGLVDLCLANSAPVQAGLVERYRAEDAVPLAVDRERVAAMGLELVERPVASEGGNFARHDPDKLAAAVLEIYRQRAVRIFQGKERYIIEE